MTTSRWEKESAFEYRSVWWSASVITFASLVVIASWVVRYTIVATTGTRDIARPQINHRSRVWILLDALSFLDV